MFEEKIRTQLQKSDWLLFLRVLFWPMGDLISRFKFMTQNRFELWSPEQISTFSPFKKEKKKGNKPTKPTKQNPPQPRYSHSNHTITYKEQ